MDVFQRSRPGLAQTFNLVNVNKVYPVQTGNSKLSKETHETPSERTLSNSQIFFLLRSGTRLAQMQTLGRRRTHRRSSPSARIQRTPVPGRDEETAGPQDCRAGYEMW